MDTRVLIIDDDTAFCGLLAEYLQGEGFAATAVHDGVSGIERLREGETDMAILDVMMPGKDGFDVLREMRTFCRVPVLMLTARGEDIDRIVGLEMGADDYVAKPCNPREIVARLRAILRRVSAPPAELSASVLTVDDIELRPQERAALRDGQPVPLTSTEFDVLELLMRSAGRVVSKQAVSESVLKRKLGPYDRSIDMHVSKLRRKLGSRPDGSDRIATVRGSGYQFVRSNG